jgi:hypothetical protein
MLTIHESETHAKIDMQKLLKMRMKRGYTNILVKHAA